MRSSTSIPSAFQQFFRTEAAASILLVGCAAVALIVANSGWGHQYRALWETRLTVGAGGHQLALTLHQWINDALMAVFFLLVGLEIKREVLAGELASPRQAALPIAGALGGMLVPALLYVLVSGGGSASRGWAIPMATDIAFALGALALAAPRAPGGLKVFLAALAIVDDIGAVLVIAFFYTGGLVWHAVAMAGACLVALMGLNLLRVRALMPYLLIGAVLWFFVHESGVHATIAGVLLAFTIPVRTRISAAEYADRTRRLLDQFERTETGDFRVMTSKGQQEAIFAVGKANLEALAPLLRLEHALHGLSAFVVMPLFALSNAGVSLTGFSADAVTLAVVVGLVVGKPIGIMAAAFLSVRLKAAALPDRVSWTMLSGCACLGGIGFTMSLFIAMLAFDGTAQLDSAKVGILAASACAAVAGAVVMRRTIRSNSA
ncbi:MAG TPA: Na+/H+ antiporter NhaA [Vicinamibacterales bacterium]|nr:Na+/H+ antiporter NhaA [Vicinamibacterales bacterium]